MGDGYSLVPDGRELVEGNLWVICTIRPDCGHRIETRGERVGGGRADGLVSVGVEVAHFIQLVSSKSSLREEGIRGSGYGKSVVGGRSRITDVLVNNGPSPLTSIP